MADITFKVPDNLPPPNIHISPAGHRVVHVAPINSESDDSSDALGQQFAKIAPLDMPQHQHNNKDQGGVQFPVNETDVAVVNPAFDPIKNPVQLTDRVIRKVYGENNSLDVSESAESLKNLPEGIKRRIIAKRMKKAKKLEKKKLKEERKRERKMEKIQLKNKMAIMKANIKKTKMDEKQRKKEIKEAARKGMSGHNDDDHGSSSSDYYDSTDDDETTRRDKALARRRRELQKQKAELENLKKLHEIEKISLKKKMKFQKRGGLPAAILGPNFENGDNDIHEQIQSSKKAMDDLKLRIKSKEKEVKIIERHHENNIEYELNLLKQNVKANIKKNKESMKYEKERAKGQEKNDKQILKEKEILAKEGAEWQNKRQHVSNGDDRTPEEIQRDKELEQRSFDEALKEREAEIRMEREAKMRMEEDARRSAAIADRELQKQENIFAPDAAEQERLKILQQLQDKRMAEGGYPPKEGITKLSHQILKQSEHQKMINYMKDLEKVKDEEHKERMQEMRKSIEERNKAAANEGKIGKKDEKKLTAQTAAEIKAQEKQEAKAKKERLKQLKKNEKEEANELKRKKKQLAELEKERKKLHDKMQKHESDEQKLMDQMNREGLKANIKRLELEKNSQNNAKCEIEQQINICMGDQIRKAAMVMRQMKANGEFEGEVLDPSTGQKEIQEMNENIERLNREFESTKQEIRDLEEFEKKTELNEIEFLKKQGIIDATRLERKHDEEIETLIQLKRNDDVILMKHQEELDKLTCEQKQIQNAQRNATDFAERAKIAEEAKLLQNMAAIIIKRKDDKEKEIDEKNAEIVIKQNEKGKLAKKEFDRLKKLGKIKEKEINRKLNERRKELNKRKAQLEKDAKDQREKTRHLEKSARKDKLEVVEKLKKEGKLKEDEEDKKKKNKINELQKLLAKQAEKEATLNKQLNDLMNEENKIAQREIDQRIGKQLLIAKIEQIEDEKKVREAQIAEHELRKREIQELEMDGEDIEEVFAKAVQNCDRKSQNSLDFEYNKTETNFGREKVSLMEIEKTKTSGSGKVEKTKTLSTGLAKNETSHQNKTMQRTKELEKINKIINDDGVDSDSDSDSDNDIREKLHLKDLRAVPSVKRVSSDSSLDTEKINAIVKAKKELEEDDTDVDTDDEMTDDEMKCDVNKPNKENLKLQKKMKKIKEKHKKKLRKEREKKLKEAEKLKKKQLKQQEKVMKEQLKKEKKELEMEVKEIEKEAKNKAKDEKKKQKEMLKNKNPALKSENNLPSDSESELDSDIEIMDIGGESENLTEKFKSQIEKNNKLKSKLLEKTKKKEDVQSQSHMENSISKEYGKNKLSKSIENKLNQAKENEDFESAQQPDKVTSDKITKLILERNENLKLRLQEKQKLLEAFGDSESETESEPEDEGPNKNTIKAEAKKKKKEAKQQGKLLKEQLKKEMKELEKEVKETEKQAKNKAKDAKKKQKEKLKKEKMKLKSGKEVFSDSEDEFDIENKLNQAKENEDFESAQQPNKVTSDKITKLILERNENLKLRLQEKQKLLEAFGDSESETESEPEDEGPHKNTIKAEAKKKKKEAKQQGKLLKEQLKKEMKELEKEVKETEKQAKNKAKDAKKKQKGKLKKEKMKLKSGKEVFSDSEDEFDIENKLNQAKENEDFESAQQPNKVTSDKITKLILERNENLKLRLQEKQKLLEAFGDTESETESEPEDEGPNKNTIKAEAKKKKKEAKQQGKLLKEQLKKEMKELEKEVKETEKQAKNKAKDAKKKQKEKLKKEKMKLKSGKEVFSDSEDEFDIENKLNQSKENEDFESAQQPNKVTSDKITKLILERNENLKLRLQEKQKLLEAFGDSESETESEPEDEGPNKNTIKAEAKKKKKEAKQQGKLLKEQLKKEMKELEKEVKETEKQAKNKAKDAKKKQKEKLKQEKMKLKSGKEVFSDSKDEFDIENKFKDQMEKNRNLKSKLQEKQSLLEDFEILESEAESELDDVINSDEEFDMNIETEVKFKSKEEEKKFKDSMEKINKLRSKLQEKQTLLAGLDEPEIDSESEDEGPDKNTIKAEEKRKKKEAKQQEKLQKEQLKKEMKELEKEVKEMEKQAKNKVKDAKKKQKEKLKIEKMKSKLGKESPAGSDIGSPGQMQRQQQGSRKGLVGNEMDIDEVIDSDNEIDLDNVSHADFNCKEENKKFKKSMDKINKLKSKLQEKQNRLNVLDEPEIDSESEDEGPDKNTIKAEKKKKKKETKQQEKLIKEQLKNEMKELEKEVKEMEKQAKNKVKDAKKKQKEKLKSKSGKVQSDSEDEIDVESKFKDEIKKNNKLKSKLREKQSVIHEVDKSGDESDSNDATANKKGGKFKFWEKLRKSKNKKESLKSKSGNEALLSKKEKLGKQNDPASDSEYESERENQVLPIIDEDVWKKIVSLRTESQKDAAISLKEAFESKHLNDLEKHKHKLEESMKKKSKKDEKKYLKKVTKDIKSDQKKKLEKERKEQKKEQADMATFMKMLFRINNRESGNMGNSSGINDAIFQGTDAQNLTSAETQREHTNKQKISENLEKKGTTSKVVHVTNQNEQDIDLHKNRTEMLNRQIKELKMHITELKPLKLINVNLLEKLYKLDEQVKIKGELTHEKFDTQSRKIKKLCKRVYCLQSEKLGLTKDLHFLQEDFHILSSDMEQLKCDSDARHLKNKNLKTRLKNYHKENTRLQTELDTRNASYKEEIERILSDCRCVISTNENDQTLMHHLKTKIIDLETTVASYRKNQREHESLAQRKQQVEFLTTDLQLRANHMIKECQTQSDEQNKIMADTKKKCQAMQANRHKDVLMETNLKCTELALVTEKVFELTEKINDKNKTISEKDKIIKTLKSSLVEKRSCNFCMRSNEKRATKVLVNDNPKRKGLKIFKRQDNGLKDFQIRELEKQIELMQTNAKSMEELKDKTEQEKLAVLENNEALKRENERLKEKSKQTIHKLTLKFQSMKRAVNATLFNQVDMELCDEDDEMAAHLHGLMNDFLMSFRRIGGNTMTPFRNDSSHGGNAMTPIRTDASHDNIKAQAQQQIQVQTSCSKCDVIKHEVSIQTETFTDQNHGTETTIDRNVSTEKKQNLMYSVTTQTDIEQEFKCNCGENKDQNIKAIKNQNSDECILAFDELTGKELYDAYSQTDFPTEKMNCEKCECDKNESEAQTDLMGLRTNIGVINETTPQIKYIKSCIKRPISPTNVAFKEPLSERSTISETDSGLNTMNTLSRIEDSSSESDLSDSEMPSKRNSCKSENIKMESKKSTNENKNAKGKKENFMDIIKNEKESEKTSDFEEKKYQSRDVSDSVIQENIHENVTICKPMKESMTSTPPQQQKSNDTITTKKKSSDLLASLFGTKTEKPTKPKIIDDDEIFNIKPYTPSINNNRRRASSLTNDGDIKDDENKQRKNEIDIEIGEEPKMRAHTPKTGRRSGSGTSDLDEINKLKNYKDPSKKREYYPGIEYERELNAEEQKMVQQLLKEPLPDPFAELDYFKKKR